MANAQTSLQLTHLWNASHALAESSPAVSAHLMTRLLDLAEHKNVLLSESNKRAACAACGTIRSPDTKSALRLKRADSHENKRRVPGKPKKPEKLETATVSYRCGVCGAVGEEEAPAPSRTKRVEEKANAAAAGGPTGTEKALPAAAVEKTQAAANALSRNRKKARKNASLSAVLAAQKRSGSGGGGTEGSSRAAGFGLELMDLMKTG